MATAAITISVSPANVVLEYGLSPSSTTPPLAAQLSPVFQNLVVGTTYNIWYRKPDTTWDANQVTTITINQP